MSLKSILAGESYSGMTDSEALGFLKEEVSLSPDSTSYTFAGINEKLSELGFSETFLDNLDSYLKALPGGNAIYLSLLTGGVDFSKEKIQTAMAYVLAGLSAVASPTADQLEQIEVLESLILIGCPKGPRWKLAGVDSVPSLNDIIEARLQIGRDNAYSAVVAKANSATSQAALALEQNLTPEEIIAAGVAGWEGS